MGIPLRRASHQLQEGGGSHVSQFSGCFFCFVSWLVNLIVCKFVALDVTWLHLPALVTLGLFVCFIPALLVFLYVCLFVCCTWSCFVALGCLWLHLVYHIFN